MLVVSGFSACLSKGVEPFGARQIFCTFRPDIGVSVVLLIGASAHSACTLGLEDVARDWL